MATVCLNSKCIFKLLLLNLTHALDSCKKTVQHFSKKTGSQNNLKKPQLIIIKNSHTFPAQIVTVILQVPF